MYNLQSSASARGLKISQRHPDPMQSFESVHQSCKRATPNQILQYKHSIILHKLYNSQIPTMDWIELNFHQTLTSSETFFNVIRANGSKISKNLLTSRLAIINKKIPLVDLNLSLDAFKVKYKQLFLTYQT